jgi:hypothetical protein
MKPEKNDVYAVLMDGENYDAVVSADLWACPYCKLEILSGFGIKRLAIGHEACKDYLEGISTENVFRFGRENGIENRESNTSCKSPQ